MRSSPRRCAVTCAPRSHPDGDRSTRPPAARSLGHPEAPGRGTYRSSKAAPVVPRQPAARRADDASACRRLAEPTCRPSVRGGRATPVGAPPGGPERARRRPRRSAPIQPAGGQPGPAGARRAPRATPGPRRGRSAEPGRLERRLVATWCREWWSGRNGSAGGRRGETPGGAGGRSGRRLRSRVIASSTVLARHATHALPLAQPGSGGGGSGRPPPAGPAGSVQGGLRASPRSSGRSRARRADDRASLHPSCGSTPRPSLPSAARRSRC